jgi:ferredoxin-NADP reductase
VATTCMVIPGVSNATPVTETPTPAATASGRIPWQRAIIESILHRTPGVRGFFLRPAAPFDFRAGQHVSVRLTAPNGYRVERSYSIASAPQSTEVIELVVQRLNNGEVSTYFHDVAAVGDEVEIRGPIGGHFVWSIEDGGPLLLVGGGSGVVPLMCMIRYEAILRSHVPIQLLLSARTWDDVIFRDELLSIQDTCGSFNLALAITRGFSKRASDYSRRVDSAMIADVLGLASNAPRLTYVCGSNTFVESISKGLLAAGLSAGTIRTERYGG